MQCEKGAAKGRETTRSPQSRRTQGRAGRRVDGQSLTVPRSSHKSGTVLGRTQDTVAVRRRAKKRGAAHSAGDEGEVRFDDSTEERTTSGEALVVDAG